MGDENEIIPVKMRDKSIGGRQRERCSHLFGARAPGPGRGRRFRVVPINMLSLLRTFTASGFLVSDGLTCSTPQGRTMNTLK